MRITLIREIEYVTSLSYIVIYVNNIYIYTWNPNDSNGKGLLLEGSTPKIEDKQVPGIYIYI